MHYYLTGKPAIIEYYLFAPFNHAAIRLDRAIYKDKQALIKRIALLVSGVFIGLFSLPFAGIGLGVNRVFRVKIEAETFNQEYKAWKNKIITLHITDPLSFHYKSDEKEDGFGQEYLILDLIRARVLASESRFKHILFVAMKWGASFNVFEHDGHYSHFTPYAKESENLLLGTDSLFPNKQNPCCYQKIVLASNSKEKLSLLEKIEAFKGVMQDSFAHDGSKINEDLKQQFRTEVCWVDFTREGRLPSYILETIRTGKFPT